MAVEKLPAIQFYTGDWRKDPCVQSLDHEHKGVWIDILCIVNETSRRGYLVLPNGTPMPDDAIARNLGIDLARWKQIRSNLLAMGVASETEDGALYNRRIARDEAKRHALAENGRKGGLSTQGRKKSSKPQANDEAKRSPSVAVAVSSSASAKLSNIQQSSGTQSEPTTEPSPSSEQPDGLATEIRTATAAAPPPGRTRAAFLFATVFHLGHDAVELDTYRETLEVALNRWDQAVAAGRDPHELNAELELVRSVENFPADEPITSAVYFGADRHETRELCRHERMKRANPSPSLPAVELQPMPTGESFEEKRQRTKQQLEDLKAAARASA